MTARVFLYPPLPRRHAGLSIADALAIPRIPAAVIDRTLVAMSRVAQNPPPTSHSSPDAPAGSGVGSSGLTGSGVGGTGLGDRGSGSEALGDGARAGATALTDEASSPPEASMTMEQLVRDHADAVYRVAVSVTRDPILAEDASQDALIKAWQALPSFRGESPLRHWILRIAHNASISLLRKRRDELTAPTDLPETASRTSVELQVQDRLAIDRFEVALRQLDGVSRSIVVLREVEGLSYDEMSDVLQLPLPTIRTRLLRARRQLAHALDGWQP